VSVEQSEQRTPRNALVVRAELVSSQKLACGKQMVPKCIAGSFVQDCAKRRAIPGLDGVENLGGHAEVVQQLGAVAGYLLATAVDFQSRRSTV
jgi:hypothetical protein